MGKKPTKAKRASVRKHTPTRRKPVKPAKAIRKKSKPRRGGAKNGEDTSVPAYLMSIELENVRCLFPKAQFVATAHSRQILQSAPRGTNLVLLRRNKDFAEIHHNADELLEGIR